METVLCCCISVEEGWGWGVGGGGVGEGVETNFKFYLQLVRHDSVRGCYCRGLEARDFLQSTINFVLYP